MATETPGQRLARLWRSGTRPDLQSFLDAVDALGPEELLDLVRLDQRESWRQGERRRVEDYLELCPALREQDEQLLDVVYHEYLLREEQGESPSLAEYRERFPELAARLERQLEVHSGLDATRRMATPLVRRPAGLQSCDSIDLAAIPLSLRHTAAHPDPHATVAPAAIPAPVTELFLGPDIPGYAILRELGRGGMGVVFLARQEGLNRRVALKMMLAGHLGDSSDFERFRIEAATLARLQHPGIIPIYDIGEYRGQPYFSLEFAAGGSLADRMRGTPQPAEVCAQLMEGLARAVDAAHQAGVIHRDLKPANVLLSPLGAEQEANGHAIPAGRHPRDAVLDLKRWLPKITDFGLAKCVDLESGQTHSGDILGTPCYMAPEQAEGQTCAVGPHSDIYSLGAILYELLTGRPPFLGENAWDTMNQVIMQDPVPPRRLQPKVPRDLETICLKCLEKEPQRRYRTALELAEDLQRFRQGQLIHARPLSPVGRVVRLVRRRPLVSALVAVIALVVAGSGILAVENLRQGKQLAEQQVDQLRRTEADRDQVRGMLHDAETAAAAKHWRDAAALLAPARALITGNPDLVEFVEHADRLHAQVTGFATAADTLQKFTALCEEARFYQSQLTGLGVAANIVRTREAAQAALALAGMNDAGQTAPVLGPYFTAAEKQEITAGCYEQLLTLAAAVAHPLTAQGEEAKTQAGRALVLLDRAERLGRPATCALLLQRADCLAEQGDQAAADQLRRKARGAAPADALDFFLLGLECYRHKDYAGALKHFGGALAKQDQHFWARYLSGLCQIKQPAPRTHVLAAVRDLTVCADQRPEFPWVFLVRGYLHTEVGDHAAAERDFARAAKLVDTPAARYTLLVNRGVLRQRQRDVARAVADFRKAIELQPEQYQAHLDLARVYQESQQLKEALIEYGMALGCAAEAGPSVLASVHRARGALYQEHGKSQEALADYTEAARHDPRPGDHLERGRILLQRHQKEDALTALNAALRQQPDDSAALHLRGMALFDLHRPAEALAALNRCAEQGKPSAAVCQLRGRVKADLGDHAGAVEDYTQALALKPEAVTYAFRGWAYLIVDAPRLALRDFDEVIQREPANGDGYNGRASACIKLGQYRLAVKDAEEAVRLDPSSPRGLYKAGRVFAQAMSRVEADANQPNRQNVAREYQERATSLLRRALEALPAEQRAAFWHAQVQHDTALVALYRSTEFLRLKNEYGKAQR